MRKLVLGTLAAAYVAMLSMNVGPVQAGQEEAKKVTICHFPGHEGDYQADGKGGDVVKCEKGGVSIEISINALCAHIPCKK